MATYWSGIVDENDLCFLGGFPGPLRKVLGIWAEEIDALYDGGVNHIKMLDGDALGLKGEYTASELCDLIHLETAHALAVYREDFFAGRPALTVNRYGQGEAYYIASRNEDRFHADFYQCLIEKLAIKRALPAELPLGVTAQLRTDGRREFVFVLNFTTEQKVVALKDGEFKDLRTGERIREQMVLPPYGVKILDAAWNNFILIIFLDRKLFAGYLSSGNGVHRSLFALLAPSFPRSLILLIDNDHYVFSGRWLSMAKNAEKQIAGIMRLSVAGLTVVGQVFLLALVVGRLKANALFLYIFLELMGLVTILWLIGNSHNSSYTVVWLVIILFLPVFGFFLYLLWGRGATKGRKSKRIQEALSRGALYFQRDPKVYTELEKLYPWRKRMAGFLLREGFPLYQNTQCRYFPLGEMQFEQMLLDLEKAERFIFIEYFILATGRLWDRIHEVLRRKAGQGVEVRILFDDFGSIMTLPKRLLSQLKSEQIQVRAFNPVHRYISRLYINYRNHQKIVVIDGNIGYTGGTNLADEYANLYPKYGHWKDTAIRLEGEAVWSLTVTFLQMWETESRGQEDYRNYRPTVKVPSDGFFQPFSDGPVNNPHNPAETMYRQVIANAKEYVYITTPYLVIDHSMIDTLCTAAKAGTDVRIITPKVYDHWYVHLVTRSNYGRLLEAGVRIYEYTPGYIHAKTILSDDDHAIIGSINMDYRSFNLQFENGVWLCGASVLKKIKDDLLATLAVSEEINYHSWQRRPWTVKILENVLRIFAPLF